MHIFRKEALEAAVIDPQKRVDEEGQYIRYRGDYPNLERILTQARADNMEIRRYVENIVAEDGGVIPLKYVITEVPPGHVQPFHSHTNVDEINLISAGEVYFIESETLTEQDVGSIREQGTLLRSGDAVVSSSDKRHTVANLSGAYALLIGTISAKESAAEFKPDWRR
ncbi:MAG: cupin domain-containing protein [Candidatus Parcubacteria bacterium]|nr:cupin domain-containing protein [Candidatus Parcubacteria bacterium]